MLKIRNVEVLKYIMNILIDIIIVFIITLLFKGPTYRFPQYLWALLRSYNRKWIVWKNTKTRAQNGHAFLLQLYIFK